MNRKIVILLALVLCVAATGGGWLLWQEKSPEATHNHTAQAGKVLYTCPMHPFVIKDKPGTCPVCGMELVKKNDGPSGNGDMTAKQRQEGALSGHVVLSPAQRVMANVATISVVRSSLNKEINAVGTVQYDQARQAKVTAWIAGRIDKLYVNAVGASVAGSRPVAEIYSPDLLSTQQEYLLAVRSRDQLKNSPIQGIAQSGEALVASAKQRLILFGVKENQIAELEKAGKPNIRLPIYTPLSGVVIDKLVQEGQYVNQGEVLFTIADLSKVWVEIDVFENEVPYVSVGQAVEIRSSGDPHVVAKGRISFVYPFHDPKTHTVKARVELSNTDGRLKPDMFVNAIIRVPLMIGVAVPVTAVIDTGKRQVVWVESSSGLFAPRDVKVGERVEDKIQILSGLNPGDKVAVSGGYLLDSESQLQGETGNGNHKGHSAPVTSPAKKSGMSMDDMKM